MSNKQNQITPTELQKISTINQNNKLNKTTIPIPLAELPALTNSIRQPAQERLKRLQSNLRKPLQKATNAQANKTNSNSKNGSSSGHSPNNSSTKFGNDTSSQAHYNDAKSFGTNSTAKSSGGSKNTNFNSPSGSNETNTRTSNIQDRKRQSSDATTQSRKAVVYDKRSRTVPSTSTPIRNTYDEINRQKPNQRNTAIANLATKYSPISTVKSEASPASTSTSTAVKYTHIQSPANKNIPVFTATPKQPRTRSSLNASTPMIKDYNSNFSQHKSFEDKLNDIYKSSSSTNSLPDTDGNLLSFETAPQSPQFSKFEALKTRLRIAWEQPKIFVNANINATNKLNKSQQQKTPSGNLANKRLSQFREALQQQIQKQESNNNETVLSYSDKNHATHNEDTTEPMDWQSVNDADIKPTTSTFNVNNDNNTSITEMNLKQAQFNEEKYYFVLDTNILINYLVFIEQLSQVTFYDNTISTLFIPYIVIHELDKLKEQHRNSGLRLKAAHAIRYLNTKFDESDNIIEAQSALDVNQHLIEVISPDDEIINCCLQLKLKSKQFCLLTDDGNLRLKAKANNIPVTTKSDITSKYPSKFDANNN